MGVEARVRLIWWGVWLLGLLVAVQVGRQALSPHRQIVPDFVRRVEVRPKGERVGHELSRGEALQVLAWYNRAGKVVNNAHHGAPGCGVHSTLEFFLQNGEVVTVFSYMRATRGRPGAGLDELAADYSFQQPELEAYLRGWDARAESKGC